MRKALQNFFNFMATAKLSSTIGRIFSISGLNKLMFCHVTPCLGSEFALEPHTGIPWQTGLRRGSALETEGDSIIVREEGFYFVYSQVNLLVVIS